jgi:RimJ/RimL family protein N-acetyltransferase
MAIVALEGDQLIAVARYDGSDAADEAEVAIVVQDRWQERGLGTILMTELLGYADARGIHRFRAYVLADNYRMLDMLHRVARVLKRRTEDGVVSLVLTRRRRTEVA